MEELGDQQSASTSCQPSMSTSVAIHEKIEATRVKSSVTPNESTESRTARRERLKRKCSPQCDDTASDENMTHSLDLPESSRQTVGSQRKRQRTDNDVGMSSTSQSQSTVVTTETTTKRKTLKKSAVASIPKSDRSSSNRLKLSSSSAVCIANPPWLPHLSEHCHTPSLLLLGSMTAAAGLSAGQYYAHAQNHFWSIMGGVLGQTDFTSQPYAVRVDRLLRAGVCLWNVLQQCHRIGSLDSAIRKPVSNDIASVLSRFPSISTIGLNGQWAYKYFIKTICIEQPDIQQRMNAGTLRVVCLISSSPACAMTNAVQVKTARWKSALQFRCS